ncbi:hypothetical protein Tco_0519907 [Tanacetum coccineum]
MADVKLARRVSMSSPTDSICSGSGGTAVGGGDGDTDDCLMVKAIWISYEVRMVKVMVVVNMVMSRVMVVMIMMESLMEVVDDM